jgi:hypothetical protein
MATYQRLLTRTLSSLVITIALSVRGQVIFTDNFDIVPSPQWGNQRGSWDASNGGYRSFEPSSVNYSGLPFVLRDFIVDVDINDVADGGIWLRSDAQGLNGVVLVTGGRGWGYGDTRGGHSLYWHVMHNGSPGELMEGVDGLFEPGVSDIHIRVEVRGDVYSAFLNGSSTPTTSLTNSEYSSGHVGLYGFSSQSFDNFVLSGTCPATSIRLSEVEICWPSLSDQFYRVEYRSDFTTNSWLPFATDIVGTGAQLCVYDKISRDQPKRFYRVVCPAD